MSNKAIIDHSGNAIASVIVDTRPMAYAMLSCLHATGRFSDEEMNHMLRSFESLSLTDGHTRFYHNENNPNSVRLFGG
ncbi:hypothetical protein ACFO4N_00350 [Camelliibacillus cellulosilyticus]|uniref:Uncharacterized protein n=1 Tax=Camelliibacillus cellulosilyticus TaxID=2174486 RepID=A0ABV9GFW7_9BACL